MHKNLFNNWGFFKLSSVHEDVKNVKKIFVDKVLN